VSPKFLSIRISSKIFHLALRIFGQPKSSDLDAAENLMCKKVETYIDLGMCVLSFPQLQNKLEDYLLLLAIKINLF